MTEKCGVKHRILEPGLSCINPCICEKIVASESLKISMRQIDTEVKTLDDALANIVLQVQTQIMDFEKMFYSLQSPDAQIRAFVEDTLRAQAARMMVNDLFTDKQQIADEVRQNLQEDLHIYGIKVVGVLLTDIRVTRCR